MADGDLDTPIRCPSCEGSFTMRQVILDSKAYWPSLHVVQSTCACCGTIEEWQPQAGEVWRGYTYAAGTAHFCGMEEYAAPELEFETDGDDLLLNLPQGKVRVPGKR